ncbi:MAG: hypothetical protein AAF950_16945 [Pseudomonadota bacterium]
MSISTADAAQLRRPLPGGDGQGDPDNKAPLGREQWKRRYSASFRLSPAAWIFIILLSLASAVTTGVAFEEFLSGSDQQTCDLRALFTGDWVSIGTCFQSVNGQTPRFVSITLALFLTVATQGVLVYASIELSRALLAFIRAVQPSNESDSPRPPSRSPPHAIGAWFLSVGTSFIAVIFFLLFLLLPLWFSVHFSYATLHRELEDKGEVRREALTRLEDDYIKAHGAVERAVQKRYREIVGSDRFWRVPHSSTSSGAERFGFFGDNMSRFQESLREQFNSAATTLEKLKGQPGESAGNTPSYAILAYMLVSAHSERNEKDAESSNRRSALEAQKAQLSVEIAGLENVQVIDEEKVRSYNDTILQKQINIRQAEKARPFEEGGCRGDYIDQLEDADDWKIIVGYLLDREEERKKCEDNYKSEAQALSPRPLNFTEPDRNAPFLNKLGEFLASDHPDRLNRRSDIERKLLEASSGEEVARISYPFPGEIKAEELKADKNCSSGTGVRYWCLGANIARLNKELETAQTDLAQLTEIISARSAEIVKQKAKIERIDLQLGGTLGTRSQDGDDSSLAKLAEMNFSSPIGSARTEYSKWLSIPRDAAELRDLQQDLRSRSAIAQLRGNCLEDRDYVFSLLTDEASREYANPIIDTVFDCDLFNINEDTQAELSLLVRLSDSLASESCTVGQVDVQQPDVSEEEAVTSARITDGLIQLVSEAPGNAGEIPRVDDTQSETTWTNSLAASEALDEQIRLYRSNERIRCLSEPVQRAGLDGIAKRSVDEYVRSIGTHDGSSNVKRSFLKLGELVTTREARAETEEGIAATPAETDEQAGTVDETPARPRLSFVSLKDGLYEYGAYAVAWWIDLAVLLLGFLATLRLYRAQHESTTLEDRIRQTIGTDHVAMNDFISALNLDSNSGSHWWTTFDEQDLRNERHLPIVRRFLSVVNADVMPIEDREAGYRLSKRLVDALERSAT